MNHIASIFPDGVNRRTRGRIITANQGGTKGALSQLLHMANFWQQRGIGWMVLLAWVFSASVPAQAAISLVRVTTCGQGPFPATVCTIPATQSGNLIVVAWSSIWMTTPTVVNVTDNGGNAYAQVPNAFSIHSNLMMTDIWYAKNSKAGATGITITPSVSGNGGAAVIWEFSGVDTVSPLSQGSYLNDQPTATAPYGAPVTTTSAGEVVIATLAPIGPMIGLNGQSAFTSDAIFFGQGWAHMVTASAGTYAAQWDIGGGEFHASTAAFKAASSGGNACDLTGDGTVNVLDVQRLANMSPFGPDPCTANITGAGVCNSTTIQRVVNASLGQGCVVDAPAPDTTKPAVSMTSPASGATVSGTATVRASATDNNAMAGVQFLLDGANLGAEVTGLGPTYTLNWNTTQASNGSHTLSARARDAAGNTATSSAITVVVSNTAPAPHQVTLNWSASPTAGVKYNVYRATVSGGPYTKLNASPLTGVSYVDTSVQADQTYYYVARAVDGNNLESVNSNQATTTVPSP